MALKAALRYLRIENANLKGSRLVNSASELFHPADPLTRRAHRAAVHLSDPEKERTLTKAMIDIRTLSREIHQKCATPKVVDLTKASGTGNKFHLFKNDPTSQRLAYTQDIEKLHAKILQSKDIVLKVAEQHAASRWSNHSRTVPIFLSVRM